MNKPGSIEEYIRNSPPEAQGMLKEMYSLLKEVAPDATECIKWGAPVFEQGTILFSFAAFRSHMNFTPTGPALSRFRDELAAFDVGQDSIKLPYTAPLPEKLIRKIAEFRLHDVVENNAKWKYR